MGWLRRLIMLPDQEPELEEQIAGEKPPLHTRVAAGTAACFLILLDLSGSMFTKDFPPSRIKAACKAVVEVIKCRPCFTLGALDRTLTDEVIPNPPVFTSLVHDLLPAS